MHLLHRIDRITVFCVYRAVCNRLVGDIDLPAEAAKLMDKGDVQAGPDLSGITRRTYRIVQEDATGRTIVELERAATEDTSSECVSRVRTAS